MPPCSRKTVCVFSFLSFLYIVHSVFGNPYFMDATLLKQLTERLEADRAKLQSEIETIAHRNNKSSGSFDADFPSHGDKEDENAAEVAEFSDSLSLSSELESALKDVNSALKAVEAGTYGKCKYCQQLIDTQRLLARPTSTSCIACKKTLTQEM